MVLGRISQLPLLRDEQCAEIPSRRRDASVRSGAIEPKTRGSSARVVFRIASGHDSSPKSEQQQFITHVRLGETGDCAVRTLEELVLLGAAPFAVPRGARLCSPRMRTE